MNKHYVLAKGAVADLKEIMRHTNDHWGMAQCRIYIDQLEKPPPPLLRVKNYLRT